MEELPVIIQIAIVSVFLILLIFGYLSNYVDSSNMLWQHRLSMDACIMRSKGLSPQLNSTIVLRMPDASGETVVCYE
jgi:hypothetical protein